MAELGTVPTWRYVRRVIPATAAGAQTGAVALASFDDNRVRRLTGVFVSGAGALQHTQLDVAGRVFADVDHQMLSSARGPLELDQVYPNGVQFSANTLVDAGGTAIAANATVLTLRYSSDPILAPSGSTT